MHRFPVASFGCMLIVVGLLLLLHAPTGAGLERRWISWIASTGRDLLIGGLAAGLSAEALGWSRKLNLILTVIAGAAVVAHRVWFGEGTTHWLLLCGVIAGLPALPALLARHGPDRGWAYGLHLVEQIFFALIAGVVVSLGLELLLGLMALLLGLDLPVVVHADTAILAYGLIAPLLLLARVADPRTHDGPLSMPAWLRWFAIWICVPLALAYLAVLEIYALGVAVAWNLPNGRLAGLTIGIAALGVLAHLVAYPCRTDGPRWIGVYHRAFYPALLPILVLCGLAVWQRIDALGLTEARYLLCLLLAWLASMVPLSASERWWRPIYAPGVVRPAPRGSEPRTMEPDRARHP
jgi:hypothetical protein